MQYSPVTKTFINFGKSYCGTDEIFSLRNTTHPEYHRFMYKQLYFQTLMAVLKIYVYIYIYNNMFKLNISFDVLLECFSIFFTNMSMTAVSLLGSIGKSVENHHSFTELSHTQLFSYHNCVLFPMHQCSLLYSH